MAYQQQYGQRMQYPYAPQQRMMVPKPQYPYPQQGYGGGRVGQDFVVGPGGPPPVVGPGYMTFYGPAGPQGYWQGAPFPAIDAETARTRRAYGTVEVLEPNPINLIAADRVAPTTKLIRSVKRSCKKVCGCSCTEFKLKARLPFQIEELIAQGKDLDCLLIRSIVIGQRMLNTDPFPASFLKWTRRRRDRLVEVVGEIDFFQPLRITVENRSEDPIKLCFSALGFQIHE